MRSTIKQLWRRFLKWISLNPPIRRWFEKYGYTIGFAQRWVCGPTVDDAVRAIQRLNDMGVYATTTLLGESITEPEQTKKALQIKLELLEAIHKHNLKSHVSIKLTQLGYDIGEELCKENVKEILELAKKYDIFVRIDMEFHSMVQGTIDIHRYFYDRGYTNFAMVFQANLRRTLQDLDYVNKNKFRIRWVKGAYSEHESVAYQTKKEIDDNYEAGLRLLMKEGTYPSVATHDQRFIELAKQLAKEFGREKHQFEFQRVYGVHADMIYKSLIAEGYRLCATVPFGSGWFPYYTRRLAENWTNIFDIPLVLFGIRKYE